MLDLIVIVPGIMGSALTCRGREIWNTTGSAVADALAGVTHAIENLALPPGIGDSKPDDGSSASNLVLGWNVWPGFYAGPGYGPLVNDFLKRGTRDRQVRLFPYDWRLSNRYSARQLMQFAERELHDWRVSTGAQSAKIVFIAHSMGGLIVRYYLEVLGGRATTRRIITIGTPYSGSAKAVKLLLGDTAWPINHWAGALQRVARTMPSIWQLLPIYRFINGRAGQLGLLDCAIPGMDSDEDLNRIRDAAAFHAEIAAAARSHDPAESNLHVVTGRGQPTIQSVTISGNKVTYEQNQNGSDHLGDGTVPRFSAVPSHWPDDANAVPVWQKHGALPNHKYVRDYAWATANALNLGNIMSAAIHLGLDLPEITMAYQPLRIKVAANRPNLRIAVGVRRLNSETMLSRHILSYSDEGIYRTTLEPQPGIFVIDAHVIGEPPESTISDVVTVLA